MPRVLALDTAGATGWALGEQEPTSWGTVAFDAKADRAERWCAFREWLERMIAEHGPAVLAYELPFHRGHGSTTLVGFGIVAEIAAYDRALTVVPVHNATIRKHAGVRHGKLVEAAHARGWPVEDDHQADAVFLLDYVTRGLAAVAA